MDFSRRLLEHGDFVRALARSLVRDAHRADDVAQETFRIALERPPQKNGNLRAWLARVARNVVLLGHRREARRQQREERTARPEAVGATADIVARLDWESRLVHAVRELDEPYRATIVHRFFEQLAPAEIARRMKVPRKTVYTRLQRALEQLRARLDHDMSGDRRAWCAALLLLAKRPRRVWGGAGAVVAATAAAIAVCVLVFARAESDAHRVQTRPASTAHALVVRRRGSAPAGGLTATKPAVDEIAARAQRFDALAHDYLIVMPEAVRLVDGDPDLLPRVFAAMKSPFAKQQILKLLGVRRNHRHTLEVLWLAAHDDDASVRCMALADTSSHVVRRMTPDETLAWLDRHRHDELRPLLEAQVPAAITAIGRLELIPFTGRRGSSLFVLKKQLDAFGLHEVLDDMGDEAPEEFEFWSGSRPPASNPTPRPPAVAPDLWKRLHPHPDLNKAVEIAAGWAERPDALAYLRSLWANLDAFWKTRALITFTGVRAHPDTVHVLALGVRDSDSDVRNDALEMLEEVVFWRFNDRAAFERWAADWEHRRYARIRHAHAQRFVRTLTPATLAGIDSFRGAVPLLKEAGLLEALALWPEPPMDRIEDLRPSPAFVRRVVLPHLRGGARNLKTICRLVGKTKTVWARDALLDALALAPAEAAHGLAFSGDIAVRTRLFDALVEGHDVEDALSRLSGVPHGPWGVEWWRGNLVRRR